MTQQTEVFSREHGPPVAAQAEKEAAFHPTAEWRQVEREAGFQALVEAKRKFIIPATVFFIAYYFALPILVGYFPGLMEVNVIGQINLAYFFALSQFFMAWILMYMYIQKARKFDEMARAVTQKISNTQPLISPPVQASSPVSQPTLAPSSVKGAESNWEKIEGEADFGALVEAKKSLYPARDHLLHHLLLRASRVGRLFPDLDGNKHHWADQSSLLLRAFPILYGLDSDVHVHSEGARV